MSFRIPCPNCGLRNVYEFTYGLEEKSRPANDASIKDWRHHLYFNQNLCGVQEEWWYHAAGCGEWLRIERDSSTNEIVGVK